MNPILEFLTNSFVVWSVLGLIVGFGTRILDNQQVKGGILVAIILGVIGANIAGFIIGMILGSSSAFDLVPLISALIGAIGFVNIQRFMLKSSPEESNPEKELSSQPTPA